VLAGQDIAATALEYARSHNLSKLVLGRAHRSAWQPGARRIERLAQYAPDLDLIEIGAAHPPRAQPASAPPPRTPGRRMGRRAAPGDRERRCRHAPGGAAGDDAPGGGARSALVAAAASVATALAATPLLAYLDLANIAMLFLLVVVLVAVRYGRGPSVLATCCSVACFDFFFVPPRFTFAISDFQYLITSW
jgi:two-component system sensor histidine kinase KdpD